MLYISLRNADNIKWNLSCIQYQSLPDRSAILARAVAKVYQLTSALSNLVGSVCLQHWFLCHAVMMCFSYYDCMIEIICMISQCALYVYAWRQMYNNKQSWKSWNQISDISNQETLRDNITITHMELKSYYDIQMQHYGLVSLPLKYIVEHDALKYIHQHLVKNNFIFSVSN